MRTSCLLTSFTLLLATGAAWGQEAKSTEDELLALLNTPVTVASGKAMTTRESPGIISLVTREEILASGARDLMDILRLVPGFDFASDIQGVVGPAVRGLWGFEGKVLLLVDGQELNETRYGTVQFGNHVPMEQIRQVEVIRGPGSAIYGGFAELAVINVVTRSAADLKGVAGAITFSATSQGTVLKKLHGAYGDIKGDWSYSVAADVGDAQRTSDPWASFGQSANLEGRTRLHQGFFNLGLAYKDFSLRAIKDDYSVEDFTFYKPFAPTPMRFSGTYVEAKETLKLSPTLQIVPRLSYKVQQPWYYPDDPSGRKKETSRLVAGVQAMWSPNPKLDLLFGCDTWKDEGKVTGGDADTRVWSNGKDTISYTNEALYGQALWNAPIGNITVGARYDRNSQFGSSFVPRVAFTHVWETFHVKALASQAFRAPAIENFELNKSVHPEKTTALELEVGTQVGPCFLSVNVFDLSVKDPMVYFYDSGTGEESYRNYPKVGSRGFEAECQIRGEWGFFKSGLTVAKARDNQVPDFSVPGEKQAFVGIPDTKLTLLGNFKLTSEWSLAPTVIAIGPRYTYESANGPLKREGTALVNVVVHYRPTVCFAQVSAGVYNLTDARIGYPKAYRGTDGDTYPSQARSFLVRVAYRF